MITDCLVLGSYQTNSYIVRRDSSAADCLIIDTGLDAEPLLAFLSKSRLNPLAVILTHGHVDHIAGLGLLRNEFPEFAVCVHRLDAPALTDAAVNLSAFADTWFVTGAADRLLDDGDTIAEAGLTFSVIHTPGHTPGGICLYSAADSVLFCGDTLFAGSVGRTDFPQGDTEHLITSIKNKLFILPDATVCFPGHGPKTTIGREKKYNPFLR